MALHYINVPDTESNQAGISQEQYNKNARQKTQMAPKNQNTPTANKE